MATFIGESVVNVVEIYLTSFTLTQGVIDASNNDPFYTVPAGRRAIAVVKRCTIVGASGSGSLRFGKGVGTGASDRGLDRYFDVAENIAGHPVDPPVTVNMSSGDKIFRGAGVVGSSASFGFVFDGNFSPFVVIQILEYNNP